MLSDILVVEAISPKMLKKNPKLSLPVHIDSMAWVPVDHAPLADEEPSENQGIWKLTHLAPSNSVVRMIVCQSTDT